MKITCKVKRIHLITLLFALLLTAQMQAQKRFPLDSDSSALVWKLKPQADIGSDSVKLFASGYETGNWVKAVVPGTVFTAYVNAGMEKDPNWGDNIYPGPTRIPTGTSQSTRAALGAIRAGIQDGDWNCCFYHFRKF